LLLGHPHHCAGAAVGVVVDYATAGELRRQNRESYKCDCTVKTTNPAVASGVALVAVGAPAVAVVAIPATVSLAREPDLIRESCSTEKAIGAGRLGGASPVAEGVSATATGVLHRFARGCSLVSHARR
jgi:hypothetical protein